MIDAKVIEQHGLKPTNTSASSALGREPNLTELGIFSVMWSEHCSYKSSRVHLRTLPTDGPQVLQGPGENAGADRHRRRPRGGLQDRIAQPPVVHRAVSGRGDRRRRHHSRHLHDGRAADRAAELAALRRARTRPAHARLVEGVVAGIAGYGNSIGIPTVGGEIAFEPLVRGQSARQRVLSGHRQASDIIKGVASGVGNAVYYVGAKTGRDGIHGATMASAEFDEKSAEKRPAVQVGDPFMEKLLLEACLEVMQTDALVGIQDMGAAGLTCSTTRDGIARRRGRRDRRGARAAARDRHDAVRDHAVRIAGAHAARRQARTRSRGRADLREVGSARRAHRRRDRRRHAAREEPGRGRGRDSESRADRRGAGLLPPDGEAGVSGGGAAARSRPRRRCESSGAEPAERSTLLLRSLRRRPLPASSGCTASTITWCGPTR